MKPCNQCGKCCINYSDGGLSATSSEIEYWENYSPDIFRYVKGGEIWFDPKTGSRHKRCPFLKQTPNQNKFTCDIYHERPEDCRHYPVTIDQMVVDGCEMLEAKDLLKPTKAQKALDEIMSDSRPCY